MNYRSIADLNNAIVSGLHAVPRDIDLIVGVPRSGMLPATLLALYLNRPFVDLEGYLEGRVYKSGQRPVKRLDAEGRRKVLVVDDSVYLGREMLATKEKVNGSTRDDEVLYGTVYIGNGKHPVDLDIVFEVCSCPRVFEWNLFHHSIITRSCVDIDGVLCEDPTPEQNDDGRLYRDFLRNAKPKWIPTVQVGSLVSCRLEKYRDETEQWLQSHNVEYRNLYLMQYATMEERKAANQHAQYKAGIYRRTQAELFIESSEAQALKIAQLSGKFVLCRDTNKLIEPSDLSVSKRMLRDSPRSLYQFPGKVARRIKRLMTKSHFGK